MRPPKNSYERVPVGVPVFGIIEVVQYDEKHAFKAFKEGEPDTAQPAVRFKFKLDGCEYAHYSRWMKFNVGAKANLYNKYLVMLIADAIPDMDIDLDILNGMKIKTVWSNNGDFQNLDSIEPAKDKIKQDAEVPAIDLDEPPPVEKDEDAPF